MLVLAKGMSCLELTNMGVQTEDSGHPFLVSGLNVVIHTLHVFIQYLLVEVLVLTTGKQR